MPPATEYNCMCVCVCVCLLERAAGHTRTGAGVTQGNISNDVKYAKRSTYKFIILCTANTASARRNFTRLNETDSIYSE